MGSNRVGRFSTFDSQSYREINKGLEPLLVGLGCKSAFLFLSQCPLSSSWETERRAEIANPVECNYTIVAQKSGGELDEKGTDDGGGEKILYNDDRSSSRLLSSCWPLSSTNSVLGPSALVLHLIISSGFNRTTEVEGHV